MAIGAGVRMLSRSWHFREGREQRDATGKTEARSSNILLAMLMWIVLIIVHGVIGVYMYTRLHSTWRLLTCMCNLKDYLSQNTPVVKKEQPRAKKP